jgi:hypothetical protein
LFHPVLPLALLEIESIAVLCQIALDRPAQAWTAMDAGKARMKRESNEEGYRSDG